MIVGGGLPAAATRQSQADAWLAPVMRYFVQLVSSGDAETAKRACEFWTGIHAIGVAPWTTFYVCTRRAQLAKLFAALIDRMIFRDDVELASFEGLCRAAESAFETIVSVCPLQLVCATLIPLIETRTESESWSVKEAAIRALRAFTNAVGE